MADISNFTSTFNQLSIIPAPSYLVRAFYVMMNRGPSGKFLGFQFFRSIIVVWNPGLWRQLCWQRLEWPSSFTIGSDCYQCPVVSNDHFNSLLQFTTSAFKLFFFTKKDGISKSKSLKAQKGTPPGWMVFQSINIKLWSPQNGPWVRSMVYQSFDINFGRPTRCKLCGM